MAQIVQLYVIAASHQLAVASDLTGRQKQPRLSLVWLTFYVHFLCIFYESRLKTLGSEGILMYWCA